jgi:hypothetical protein
MLVSLDKGLPAQISLPIQWQGIKERLQVDNRDAAFGWIAIMLPADNQLTRIWTLPPFPKMAAEPTRSDLNFTVDLPPSIRRTLSPFQFQMVFSPTRTSFQDDFHFGVLEQLISSGNVPGVDRGTLEISKTDIWTRNARVGQSIFRADKEEALSPS